MKKQEFLNDLHAMQDQELINSFKETLGINTDDFLLLNKELFDEDLEEDDPIDIGWHHGKMRA